ncbi:hypothetical cytosolic protein [Syntrophus aciditrophicus SB]|uniref:Hypothetical cytosolic protein n=1 Tax=Syntrophus aciditrophicus (strain SB) TaxID=56780 RepID=Q2LUL2_SYNAS|nr:hypothetical cytosolic protein [Syntrophus aciditrophicus SB]
MIFKGAPFIMRERLFYLSKCVPPPDFEFLSFFFIDTQPHLTYPPSAKGQLVLRIPVGRPPFCRNGRTAGRLSDFTDRRFR